MNNYFKFIIGLAFLLPHYLFAQINGGFYYKDQISMPSPGAASMAQNVASGVNLSTGAVSVSIPLMQVQSYAITMPITLGYTATGVKINDLPTQIGSGWGISAGGMITRVVKQRPDGQEHGFSDFVYGGSPGDGAQVEAFLNQPDYANANKFLSGEWDNQVDEYFFQFMGRSGRFVVNKEGNAILIPQQDLKIRHVAGAVDNYGSDQRKSQWVIITSDGTRYLFGTDESSPNLNNPKAVEITEEKVSVEEIKDCFPASNNTSEYASAWYLREVISPSGNVEMSFSYTTGDAISYDFIAENKYERVANSGKLPDCAERLDKDKDKVYKITSTIKIKNPKYLISIATPMGQVLFNYASRDDLPNGKRLDYIEVKNNEATIIKKITFAHSYFYDGRNDLTKRLKLDAVSDGAGTYRFYYNQNVLPSRNSPIIDYWGYYNGRSSNTNMIVPLTFYGIGLDDYLISLCKNNEPCIYSGANRDADEVYTQASVLTKVLFPDNGYEEYTYQLNDYYDFSTSENKSWGGLRIKSIKRFDGMNENKSIITNYNYTMQDGPQMGKSSGTIDESFSIENRKYYKSFNVYQGLNFPVTGDRVVHFIVRTSDPINTFGSAIDQVIYRSVTVSQAGLGKTVSLFTSHADVSHKDILAQKFGMDKVAIDFNHQPFMPNTSRSWERGLPTDIKVYSEDLKLRNWKHFEYDFNPAGAPYSKLEVLKLYSSKLASYVTNANLSYDVSYGKYSIESKWFNLAWTTDRIYDMLDETKYIESRKDFKYNTGNLLVSEVSETNSEGKIFISKYKYPIDYPRNGEVIPENDDQIEVEGTIGGFGIEKDKSVITNEMMVRNMVSPIMETQVWQKDSPTAAPKLLSASATAYKLFPKPSGYRFYNYSRNVDVFAPGFYMKNTMLMPYKIINFYSDKLVAESDYTPTTINAGNEFVYDGSKLKVDATFEYDDKNGHLIALSKRTGNKMAVIWDSKNGMPMARVDNAELNQVAYTSFEVDGETGNWVYTGSTSEGKTGDKSFSGTVQAKSTLPAGKYKVSFWYKGSGNIVINNGSPIAGTADWTYKEVIVDVTTSLTIVTGTAKIDELRLCPVTSRMISNTYKPFIGVNCTIDINGAPSYFEYDNQQRLKLIRDLDYNILKHYDYKVGFGSN